MSLPYRLHYKKEKPVDLSTQIATWLENTLKNYNSEALWAVWQSERLSLIKQEMTRQDSVFVSTIQLIRQPEIYEVIKQHDDQTYEYDFNRKGYWVKQPSPLLTHLYLLGVEPYGDDILGRSGQWTRHGRIR